MPMPFDNSAGEPGTTSPTQRRPMPLGLRALLWIGGVACAGLASILIIVGVALAVAYPNLPDVSDLSDYRPKLPLRVYSADGVLIGDFGEDRRNLTPIN